VIAAQDPLDEWSRRSARPQELEGPIRFGFDSDADGSPGTNRRSHHADAAVAERRLGSTAGAAVVTPVRAADVAGSVGLAAIAGAARRGLRRARQEGVR